MDQQDGSPRAAVLLVLGDHAEWPPANLVLNAFVQLGRIHDQALRPNANAADPTWKVICVYAYNGDDEADVWRVRDGLRRLGFAESFGWKPDQATRDGLYQVRGHTRVSRYWG